MCGIAGGIGLSAGMRPDRERVRRMSCLIAHRGPDDDGLWEAPSGRAVLAHRRLAVIDLVTGHQPMMDPSGRTGLVFNGEIYNYRALRAQLAAEGARFETESDTEVLLRLYERRGAACVDDLRGMFAFAVWDDDAGRLVLARDRIGKKPLFHAIDGDCLYFASSLGAIRETSPGRREVDPAAVDAFLTLSYIPAPRTIYRGVSKLEAGTVLTADDRGLSTRRYWDLSADAAAVPERYEDAVDRLDEMLNGAVALRLRSDVPLGVFLSGGIDSSLVAAIAARQSPTPIATFSIGFDVASFDETPHATRVAQQLGTDHRVFRARPDLLRTLPSMVRHFGEPFADSSALATWMLAEQARKHVTVALAGDGGDEGFAGYDWYRTAARLRRMTQVVPGGVFRGAGRALDGILRTHLRGSRAAGRLRRGLSLLGVRAGAERAAMQRTFVGPGEADTLYAAELRAVRLGAMGAAAERLAQLYRDASGSDLRRERYVDVAVYLADCLMPKVDVATMAHGLETRAPLLDQEVIRFALGLPDAWLIDRNQTKRILRSVLARYLPLELFDRPKQGFSVPLTRWFTGSIRPVAAGLPASSRLVETGWFQPTGLRALVDEHMAGLRDHSQRLFSLLVLDEWLRTQ